MGLIEIRHRSERLGNLGGVREADVHTGAARVLAGMADVTAQDGRSDRALAGVVPGLLDGAKKLTLDFAVAQERRDNEMADRYVARYQQGMDAYNNGSVDVGGKRVPGAMETDFGDSGEWLASNVTYRDRFGAELGKELKMSDRAMEIAKKRLVGYDLHMQNRWQARAARADDVKAQSAAGERLQSAHSGLANVIADGDTNQYGADYALALDEWGRSLENVLDRQHVPEEARPAARRNAAMRLCKDVLAARLRRCDEAALRSEDATPEYVKSMYKDLEKALKESGWEGVFPFGPAALAEDGKAVADPIRECLEGADMDAFAAAALEDLGAARARSLREVDARERERIGKLRDISANALAKGGLDGLVAAYDKMSGRAREMPDGSRMQTVPLQEAKRLDAAADAEAQRSVLESLLEHAGDKEPWKPSEGSREAKFYAPVKEYLDNQAAVRLEKEKRRLSAADAETRRLTWAAIVEHADDKEPWTPPKGSPMEKFYAPLKASYDQQRAAYTAGVLMEDAKAVQEQRKANETTMRAQMMTAAATAPGTFLAQLADFTVKGHLSVDQYRKLADEFNTVWTKEGMPRKAALMEDAYREIIGGGENGMFDVSMAYNPRTVERVPGGPSSEYESAAPDNIRLYSQETFTAEDYSALFKWATRLARLDGQTTTLDPLTNELLDKPKKIDAVEEFRRACHELKSVTRVRSAREVVTRAVDALADINVRLGNENRAAIEKAEKVEAEESRMLQTLKQQKRKPFAPKMPRSNAYQTETPTDDEPEI